MFPANKAYEPSTDELSVYDESGDAPPTWSEKPDAEAVIRFPARGVGSEENCPAMTVATMFARAVERAKNEPALYHEPPDAVRLNEDGSVPPALPAPEWRMWTWEEYYEETRSAGKAMISLGHEMHEAVTVFGFNAPEWMMSALSAMFIGGKASGVYPSDTLDQFSYKVLHSNSSIVCVEGKEQLDMFTKVATKFPRVHAVVVWGPDGTGGSSTIQGASSLIKLLTWKELIDLGRSLPDDALEARFKATRPGHCCSLIYTSGTTGEPKAVMVTHDNILFESRVTMEVGFDVPIARTVDSRERIVSYLPLSHVAGQVVDMICPICSTAKMPGSASIWFARNYDLKLGTLVERLRACRPTIFLGVPRVWEKMAEKLRAVGATKKGIQKAISTWAKRITLQYMRNQQVGKQRMSKSIGVKLAAKLFMKIRLALGLDKMKFALSGAAPLSLDTLEYFASLGINVNECYGMSECTAASTFSSEKMHVWGSVGYALPGMEVKVMKTRQTTHKNLLKPDFVQIVLPRTKNDLAQAQFPEECQGELCFRGRHVALGYMANAALGPDHVREIQQKNAETFDSAGWLHSGDMGVQDRLGFFKVTGRYKELIIGAGGENIAPVPLEDSVRTLLAGIVSNVQVIGDSRKFNTLIVTLLTKGATGEKPGSEQLDSKAATLDPSCTTVAQARKSPIFAKAIADAIRATNSNGLVCPSQAAKIQKFTILPRDFSVETGELTATLKLKRNVTTKVFAMGIDKMYEEGQSDVYVPFPT